ncbi:MAG: putative transport protein [Mycobacterium sp.]|jgi:cation diffusion facilitator family transporter|nr:putative transport protein [Mycobacterium sp.]
MGQDQPGRRAASEESTGTVLLALAANLIIALAKLGGGLFSGSASLLSEAAHSFADTFNEVFLLLALKRSRRPADERHPFGYGSERYFWSLLAAVGIFVTGAAFSAYQGIHTIAVGEADESVRGYVAGYVILGVSALMETTSLLKAVRQLRGEARAAGRTLLDHFRRTPDPTVKTVASEDGAAVIGLSFAAIGTGLHQATGDAVWDGLASLAIALLLAVVAFTLGADTKSALIGEAADPELRDDIRRILEEHPGVNALLQLLTLQVGPRSIVVAARVDFDDRLDSDGIEDFSTRLDREIRAAHPEVEEVFLDPTRGPGARRRTRSPEAQRRLDELLAELPEELRGVDLREPLGRQTTSSSPPVSTS